MCPLFLLVGHKLKTLDQLKLVQQKQQWQYFVVRVAAPLLVCDVGNGFPILDLT